MNRVQKKEMCFHKTYFHKKKKKNKLLHVNLKIEGGSEFASTSNLCSFSEQKRRKALSVLTP